MIFASIVFAGLALALSFVVSAKAAEFGPAVAARFLERGTTIPPGEEPLTALGLERWLSDPEHRKQARGYVHSVLPWDIAFLASLGAFLALGSAQLASDLTIPGWVFWLVPGTYMAADATEDALIARTISATTVENTFDSMRRATSWKIKFASLSFVQLFACAGYAGIRLLAS